MMANLAAPTKDMRRGLKALGIEAWDAQGRFRACGTSSGNSPAPSTRCRSRTSPPREEGDG